MESGSYRLREHFRDVDAELARLEAQAVQFWPKEAEVFERRGLPSDAHVLEVGCGPGFVTERLLTLVPDGAVTGIDNDGEMIALASRRLAGVERVDVREASVDGTGFPDSTFDVVTARLVLQHLPDPAPAVRELHRVLRPGGRLFVTDVDDGWELLLDPEPPRFEEVTAALGQLMAARGGDRKIGRRLPRLLTDAGFADLTLDIAALHTLVDGEETAEIIGGLQVLEQLADAGFISREAFDEIRDYAERFERGELTVDGLVGVLVVSGRKQPT